MKKLISLFLSLIMIVSIVAVGVVTTNAETFTDENGVSWNLTQTFPGYAIRPANANSIQGEITIPSTYNGKVITAIADYAFWKCNGITKIIVPASVMSIGISCFFDCQNLESVILPNSITELYGTFQGCTKLNEIVLPNNLKIIGSDTFAGCSIENFEIPSSVTTICSLPYTSKNVIVPEGVKALGGYVFGNKVESVVLPDSLESIDGNTFYVCSNLKHVKLPNSIEILPKEMFAGCESLETIVLPESVRKIDDAAFLSCISLRNINIPNSVEYIGNYAFDGVPLSDFDFATNSNLKHIGENAFNYSFIQNIHFPDSLEYIGKEAFNDCYELQNAYFSQNTQIKFIGKNAFHDAGINKGGFTLHGKPDTIQIGAEENVVVVSNNGIDYKLKKNPSGWTIYPNDKDQISGDITLPSIYNNIPITCVGDFSQCEQLTSIIVPNTVTELIGMQWSVQAGDGHLYYSWTSGVDDNGAFNGCSNLQNISLPDSLSIIGDGAFSGCGLSSIVIPDSVKALGEGAFSGCGSLSNVRLPNGLVRIEDSTFSGCNSLKSIVLPDSVEYIGKNAFEGHMFKSVGLESITLSKNLKQIDSQAFMFCKKLSNVVFPDTIETIGQHAFYQCYSINNINLPNSIKSIGDGAFYSCGTINTMYLDVDTLSNINATAFYGCDIQNIELGNNVHNIDTALFSGNPNLEEIMLPDSCDVTNKYAFFGDDNLTVYTKTRNASSGLRLASGFPEVPLKPIDGIINSGESKDAIVTLTTDPAIFKVTVPTVLPFTVDSDSNVIVANNAVISNKCNGQVKVTNVKAQTTDGWAIVANDTDFREVPVDSKQFTFTLNGDSFGPGKDVDLTLGRAWTVINGKEEIALPYSGTFAVQSQPKVELPIANTIFTIAWNKAA